MGFSMHETLHLSYIHLFAVHMSYQILTYSTIACLKMIAYIIVIEAMDG